MKVIASLVFLFFSPFTFAADWAADWLEGSLSGGGPTYYEGASRNYLSLGNLSYRTDASVDYPLTISAPRLKAAGCGGIDGFLGGISYMDLDMLVEKFEQMIQNGEVIAFQLAIKALSEKLGTTVEGIEAIINKINSVQLDSCAMAKAAVTTVVDGGGLGDAMGNVWEEVSQGQDMSADGFKNTYERAIEMASNNGTPSESTDISKEVNACPAYIKEALLFEGSLLESMAGDFGLTDYTDVLRGYIGDMYVLQDGDGNLPIMQEIPPCADNDLTNGDDLVYGTSYAAPAPDDESLVKECYQNDNRVNLVGLTEDNLSNLSSALKDPDTSLADYDGLANWIQSSPLPVYGIMQSAVNMGIEDEVNVELQNVLAYAYAYQMFDDLFKTASRMFNQITIAVATNSFDGEEAGEDDVKKCNLQPYMHLIKGYESFALKLNEQHQTMRESYGLQLGLMSHKLDVLSRYERHAEKYERTNMGQSLQ